MGGRDLEVIRRITAEPPTDYEKRCMEGIGPAEFEVLTHRLQTIALEANEVLMRTAGSPAALAGDIGACIYTAEGDPAAAAVGIWAHAFAGQLPIKYILKHWKDDPTVGINDGDAFLCNEALYGGIHAPDVATFMPIFHEGELIGWAECMVHTADVGSIEIGGISLAARNRYDEGLKMPPVKIAEGFRLKGDILTMMENMVRDPRVITLDNKARLAACMRIRQRVLEVVEKKGADHMVGGLRKMIEEGSKVARKRVAEMNDGTYRHPVFMNLDLPEALGGGDAIIRLMLTVRKEGEKLVLDFSGSSPEAEASFNCYSHLVHPYGTGHVCCSHLFPDLPPSLGLTDVFDLKVPDGCVLNPGEEAAVGAAPGTFFASIQALFAVMAKVLFDTEYRRNLVSTYPYMTLYVVWGGIDRKGNYFVGLGPEINAGGFAARSDMDGVDTAGFNVATRSDCEEVETVDLFQSMSYLWRRQGTDNFGHGKHRGGAGIEFAYMAYKAPMMVLMSVGGCGKFSSAPGIFGGYAAPPLSGIRVEGSGIARMMEEGDGHIPTSLQELFELRDEIGGQITVKSAMREMTGINEGDVFVTMQGGGGGYGDALEREPHSVMRDVVSGLVSQWAARDVYRVAFDPETLLVDYEETERLREEEREERRRRGRPYQEFEQEWLQKRPPEGSLEYYGSWPDCM